MPIFDQGYQHWKGQLSGHAWRWLAIARHGTRTQLNGRYIRLLIIMAWTPALALVTVLALWGMIEQGVLTPGPDSWLPRFVADLAQPKDLHACRQAVWTISYSYFFWFELYFIMLIVTLAGPNLISRDLRFNALPLYLSRPMTRLDYFLGKLGMIAGIVAAVAVIPAVAAYVLGVCFSLDLSVVRDTWRLLPASIIYGTVIVVSAGTLMLALSSLSRRSLYVGLTWIGVWLITSSVAGVLDGIHREAIIRDAWRAQQSDALDPMMPQPRHRGPGRVLYARMDSVEEALAEAAKTDWRPLFSYPANLQRLGEAALDTDTAWVNIGRAMESSQSKAAQTAAMLGGPAASWMVSEAGPRNERRLADERVPQYPWTWSAAVLAGLLGLSLWILSMRIRSLDRLR
jgi:ABC-2 type transport system permease protein